MPRPILATIHIDAMSGNLARVRACAPAARTWAVVKAQAYGHGLAAAVRGFAHADGLAVVEFDAALRLRELGWQRPILMLEGAFEPPDVALAREHRLALVVHEPRQLAWLEGGAGAGLDVHLKLNSGMNRLGFDDATFRTAHERLRAAPVASITLMTHFANADLPGGCDEALRRFDDACRGLVGARSLANSAAIFDCPPAHGDWVRPGIMLYGASPFADRSAAALGLAPAMTLRSRIIAVRELAAGDAVGYGSTFVAPRAMRAGVVACGYADGYPRHAPTGTPVGVDGARTRTLGRVSMDMLVVDLDPVPQAGIDAPVELWGRAVSVDEVAHASGTIGYELLCALAPRVPRAETA